MKVWIYKGDAPSTRAEREAAAAAARLGQRQRPERPRRGARRDEAEIAHEEAAVSAPSTESEA